MLNRLLATVCLILTTISGSVALQVGNTAPRLDIKKWLKNGPASIIIKPAPQADAASCRAVVFWGTWNPNLKNDIATLSFLQQRYGKHDFKVIAISREPVERIAKVLREFKINYAVAADRESRTTMNYMQEDQVFPKVFLVNKKREIIWKGEIADLEEVLRAFFSGSFDINQQLAISTMHKKLRFALRSFDSQRAEKIIDNILKEAPDDGFAIRAAIFLFDKNHQPRQAISFIDQRIKIRPENLSLRLTKLRLLQQYFPYDTKRFAACAEKALKAFQHQPEELNTLAWFIMNSFTFTPDITPVAIAAAQLAYKILPASASPRQRAACKTTLARAYAITGNIAAALRIQEAATRLLRETAARAQSMRYEEYYRQLLDRQQHHNERKGTASQTPAATK